MIKFVNYTLLGFALIFSCLIVLSKFNKDEFAFQSSVRSHLIPVLEKDAIKLNPLHITSNYEFDDLLVFTSNEFKDAFSLEFLCETKLEQEYTSFNLIVSYRDSQGRKLKSEINQVIIVKGDGDVVSEFVLDQKVLKNSSKVVLSLTYSKKKDFIIERLKGTVKVNCSKGYLPELGLIKGNEYLFPINQKRKYIDLLILDNFEKYKDVRNCQVEVFGFKKTLKQDNVFLVFEYNEKSSRNIGYISKVINTELVCNRFVINNFDEYVKEGEEMRLYLFSEESFISNIFQEVVISFYK